MNFFQINLPPKTDSFLRIVIIVNILLFIAFSVDSFASSLSIKLIGTIVGTEGSRCAVIQNLETGNQKILYPGDRIKGAVVVTILRERIILGLNGQEKTISTENFMESEVDKKHEKDFLTPKMRAIAINRQAKPTQKKPLVSIQKYSFIRR